MSALRRPVVAALTGGADDDAVLTAATTHALLHHHPLRLIAGPAAGECGGHLDRAAARIRSIRPGLAVTTASGGRPSIDQLAATSATAAAVVASHRTTSRILSAVRCPLLTVPDPLLSRPGPVLVALDPTDGGHRLLEHAFAEADARGLTLRAVFAWTAPLIASRFPLSALDLLATHGDIDRQLAEQLAGWSQKYPDVVVERDEIRCHDILTTLIRAAAGAGFLVVGARPGPVVGPVTRALLATARCPVLTVPLPAGSDA